MLDVHPADHAAHSWRDFFVHIATIVVGLLIAVALEQTVEWVHHRYEVRELREALTQERDENRKLFPLNVAFFRLQNVTLQNNMKVLLFMQQHPGVPEEKLPAAIKWDFRFQPGAESVWKAAQQSQALDLLPRSERESDADFYRWQEQVDAATRAIIPAMISASGGGIIDTDQYHMPAAQLAEQIQATRTALQLTSVWGISLLNLNEEFPDFLPALTPAEVVNIPSQPRSPSDQKKLAPLEAITKAKLASAQAEVDAATKVAFPGAETR